jgi:hypothetical protein
MRWVCLADLKGPTAVGVTWTSLGADEGAGYMVSIRYETSECTLTSLTYHVPLRRLSFERCLLDIATR